VKARQPDDDHPESPGDSDPLKDGWRGVRTILVPQDIVAVPRTSPVRVKKRTPWFPQKDHLVTLRAGNREWFSDRLFVDAHARFARSGYGTSVTLHACSVGAVILLVILNQTRTSPPVPVHLVMPVMATIMPYVELPPRPPSEPTKIPAPPAPPLAPAHTTIADVDTAQAPIEAPTGITPEVGTENQARVVEGGVAGGVPGGVVGGIVGGTLPPAPPIARAGTDLEPPKKIKDVRPVYPDGVLPGRTQGTVVIEATIGIDGRVQDAKVLRSVPLLDRAALDAVRQWEYLPSLLNGVRVAVIVTVVVNFALR
jgi:protein TonB